MSKQRISVALSPETIRLIDEACKREHRSRSNMIEVILRRYFGVEEEIRSIPRGRV